MGDSGLPAELASVRLPARIPTLPAGGTVEVRCIAELEC